MNKKIVLLILMVVCSELSAQSCPGGIPSAGNPFCLPPNHPNSPHYQGTKNQEHQTNAHWQLTWGGVAMSTNGDGGVGVAIGKYTKEEAKSEAIYQCELLSQSECELVLAYHNQCVVIAWPSQGGESVGGIPIVRGGPSVKNASEGALATCSKERSGKECKIVYSDCTRPVLVQ